MAQVKARKVHADRLPLGLLCTDRRNFEYLQQYSFYRLLLSTMEKRSQQMGYYLEPFFHIRRRRDESKADSVFIRA